MFSIQGEYFDDKPTTELQKLQIASNIHKDIQNKVKTYIKPNVKLLDIVKFIENNIENELPNQINKGKGFPVGVSVNNCAAHFTCHEGCNKYLKKDDMISIDYGVHYDGFIIDSAFTFSLDNKFDDLLNISRKTTDYAIKNLNIDVDLKDWGELIQEYVTSKEVEIDNKKYGLRTIKNLTGHNILPWKIHGGISLPSFGYMNHRIKEGNYAVEIFVTTGDDQIYHEDNDNSHYTFNNYKQTKLNKLNNFQKELMKRFKTLPFCDRWVSDIPNYRSLLNILTNNNIVKSYPPIYEKKGYVSQFENTVYLKEGKKIVLG